MTMTTTGTMTTRKTDDTPRDSDELARLDSWLHEKESAWLYRRVAAAEPDPHKRRLFLQLGAAAEVQAAHWAAGTATARAISVRRSARASSRGWSRRFGPKAMRGVLAAMKLRGLSIYSAPPVAAGPPDADFARRSRRASPQCIGGNSSRGRVRRERRARVQREPA